MDVSAIVTTPEAVSLAAQAASVLEVSAPKPGNVSRSTDFADTRYEDFLLSAVAIGASMLHADRLGVGEMIWRAVRDTRRLVSTNTNLGIMLLLAPLARACFGPGALRDNLNRVLHSLTIEDAQRVYAAIRLAQPGGLGRVTQADVANEPDITLYQAMAIAQHRDAIAREYVTDFATTFEVGYPAFARAWQTAHDYAPSIVQTYLTILSQLPDTLIARKRGLDVAQDVSRQAAEVLAQGGALTAEGRAALAEMDHRLRDRAHTLNPGTTADLTAAATFVFLVSEPDIAPGWVPEEE